MNHHRTRHVAAFAFAFALPAVGCSSSDSEGAAMQEPCALVEGTQTVMTEVDGQMREYILEVPPLTEGVSAPLVINMHGFTSSFEQQKAYMDAESPSPWTSSGFVLVYPNGLDSSWNGGTCCGGSALDGVDDVAFIRSIVTELSAQECVDEKRVYATGMSNGGFMSYRLACEASDLFAAVAPVASVLGLEPEDCDPEFAIPVIAFNSLDDPLVPYDGGDTVGNASLASVDDSIAHFRSVNGCTGEPEVNVIGDLTTCYESTNCAGAAEVVLCASEDSGHCWPGIDGCPFVPGPANDISASASMIEFFNRHQLGD